MKACGPNPVLIEVARISVGEAISTSHPHREARPVGRRAAVGTRIFICSTPYTNPRARKGSFEGSG